LTARRAKNRAKKFSTTLDFLFEKSHHRDWTKVLRSFQNYTIVIRGWARVHHYMPWQERARCREFDPEVFFPEKGGSSREAKRICAECEVRIECLNYALRRDERYGVWGGMSERERRRLKRMAS
jgi:WhiB family transcriptional regulator, redox-sensing transcriptional regulator